MGQVGEKEPMAAGSYWEATAGPIKEDRQLVGDARFDVAIIGAGYTGLSAALKLASSGVSVCLLDARRAGWGASGRNGGFCCFGGTKRSYPDLVRHYGLEETKRFVAYQCEAMELVGERLQSWQVDAARHSRGEVYLAHRPKDFEGFKAEAEYLNSSFGLGARVLNKEEAAKRGLAGPEFHGAMHVPQGFALHPLRYVQALADKVRSLGARVFAHSEVTGMKREGADWRLVTRLGSVRAPRVLLAGNAYSREGAPAWLSGRLLPVMSSIMVTRPLTDDELSEQGWTSGLMASDTRTLLHYFRLMPDRRFLFGTRGGVFESAEALKAMYARGRADFERMFPAWTLVDTEYAWHGHVALSRSRAAFTGPVPGMEGVFASLAYHGSGVAMASLCGEKAGGMILGEVKPQDLPAVIGTVPRRFPLAGLRQLYLLGAYGWYGLKDR
ncbi:NAD(P)/FAD-dependent oxidoreductase [Roseibium suaedae]|uniref:Glycine/D-amino acid oxidase n=1 Tax=Roseibium suaedae TaxID=735517 RepID=A0A1M7H9V0_9HYPH|nr:FAD-dependent oxidoreductase [Roseibium suaedae]SHM25331.1 Glycine/D-amino acid oxidase [Roseibium suaedae]